MVKMNQSLGEFKIHTVGFYNLAPRQIKCMSYNKDEDKLAVARDDASIEIWDMRHAAYMEKCILGQASSSVEGLGWLKNRLFSTGQTGELIEWNLQTLEPKAKKTLTGNTAWCMDIDESNNCIAIGTDEGYINVFNIDDSDLNFEKLFDKQEGRILCCKYDSTGNYIVTGSTDTIRLWNAKTGHAIHRMMISRSETKKETFVWSLVVLKDLTIIAGDSRGYITVWNGDNGTQIDSWNALDADVLTVAVNDAETMFCCSGVDPKIKIYRSVDTKKHNQSTRQWVKYLKRSVHDHDVKSMTFVNDKIVSGGNDGFIKISHSEKEAQHANGQHGPFLPQPCATVAKSSRFMLLKYFNYLEVWKLGRPSDNIQLSEEVQKQFLLMDEKLEKLVEVRSNEPITCASISPDGMFLLYSTENKVLLFQLDVNTTTKKKTLTKVKVDSDKFTPCAKVLFSSDSKSMYCVKKNGDIEIFSVTRNDEVDTKATIYTSNVIKDTISIVCLSKCEKYLVCAGACGTVAIWTNNKNQWINFKTLKFRDLPATAIEIHNESCRIVLAFSDYKVIEYDLMTDTITCVTLPNFRNGIQGVATNTAIRNIILDERNENVVIFHNDECLFVLEKGQETKKKVKTQHEDDVGLDHSLNYKLKKKIVNYKHFLHLTWLSASEIVVVSVNPVTLIEQLPPCMKQKKFGVS